MNCVVNNNCTLSATTNNKLHVMNLAWKVENREDYHPPSLYHPHGVGFQEDSDNVVVAEGFWPYSRVHIFSASRGRSRQTIGQGVILPYGVAISPNGDHIIAVTDHRDRTVKFVCTDTSIEGIIRSWSPGMFEWPTGIAIDSLNRYYVSDWARGRIGMHDASGRMIRSIETLSSAGLTQEQRFSCPVDIVVDQKKRVIVTDAYDRRVKFFDETGALVGELCGVSSDKRKDFVDPRGVCVDPRGNIVVADSGNGTVKLYDANGRWIEDILDVNDGIKNPWGVAIRSDGLLALTQQKLRESPALKVFRR